jgi:uncharacterized protein YndB with AHSA1/START domain
MERKTQVNAPEGKQDLTITREFDLPLELLFKAYSEPELLSQWMGTKVIKLENKKHGGWEFQTSNAEGQVVFQAHGAIHEFIPEQQITRTFEMAGVNFGVQLESIHFEALTPETSKLTIHTLYRSVEDRDAQVKMGFASGINWAHNRLQEVVSKLK